MSAARRATYGEVWSANYERPAPRREAWAFTVPSYANQDRRGCGSVDMRRDFTCALHAAFLWRDAG